jgi:3-hydroxyisobutyrate dehydrogenase-like beta-hydroxyacid dehydrogenase
VRDGDRSGAPGFPDLELDGMDKIVGMIGLGIMGGAIAPNLVERGWTVVGYDIDPARTNALAATGVTIAASVQEVARKTPTIMTSLPGPAAAHAVADEIARSGESSRIVIELSTLTIADKIRFRDILVAGGHIALDCPLSGTGSQAQLRDLIVYASGDSEAIGQSLALFADFAKQSADLGAFGNGSRMKFIANHLVAINNVATAEAMVLAERAGLDLRQVVDLVGPGAGGSKVFQLRAPMMVEGVYEPPTMRISTWKKDMAIIAEFAEDLKCPTPVFTSTQAVYTDALKMGLGGEDTAAVFRVLETQAAATAASSKR